MMRLPGTPPERVGVLLAGPALTVCGHVHWHEPVATLGDGHVLNVDGRAVVLTAGR
ncbi:hypothetical protein GCM10010112_32890 [Actinoplanes lobatus]|uniref:Metallophosphoesterase n=1 Tax=Actinoplanes lobatus TaxID=113568 RepID=A0A7W7MHT6_9ACTN|nr:hypothetical protein [Actinoplanes lobatus]MBB4750814.1 hypothetical protein [Actinoplanes lobatus]GGN68499.1 hypothetical protein GCM10010112_32890 [Actinoplanes lobatus]GIE42257.1 hypothetical protein Alo02nite_51550 [Actinoplanes lobatus]